MDIISFIRKTSNQSTMKRALIVADGIDEKLGQKIFLGQKHEYGFMMKYGKYG